MSFFKSIWKGNSKHKKLCEEWALTSTKDLRAGERALPAVAFLVKYLGSTLVEAASNERATADAVKSIINMAKASGKKLARASLSVTLRGISVLEAGTENALLQVSIYRISYCSADAAHDHVFAFITTNADESLECHAFLCPKRKIAQTVTLTVARSFNTVYELYHLSECGDVGDGNGFRGFCSKLDDSKMAAEEVAQTNDLLVDLAESQVAPALNDSWVSFENEDTEHQSNRPRPVTFSSQRLGILGLGANLHPSPACAWGDLTQLL